MAELSKLEALTSQKLAALPVSRSVAPAMPRPPEMLSPLEHPPRELTELEYTPCLINNSNSVNVLSPVSRRNM